MKRTEPMAYAVILTTVFIVLVTLISELFSEFKNMLASLFYHHWAAKSILSIVIFFAAYYSLSKHQFKRVTVKKQVLWVCGSVIAGYVIITVFYVWHYFA